MYIYNKITTQMSSAQKNKRSSYKKITQELREEIIERILTNGQNIKQISAELNINVSTCKAIIKVFQEEGRIGKKKRRNKILNVVETFSFYEINNGVITPVNEVKIQQSKISLQRNQDVDKQLQQNAKEKAQKMLDGIIQTNKNTQLANAEMQRQMLNMQMFNNPYMLYPHYNPMIYSPHMNFQVPPQNEQTQNQAAPEE